jgi:Protein of unknown function (DUF3501)
VFENRETIKYQVQEMARIERLITDAALADELAAYNPLIPGPGQLCATLYIELTSDDAMREWLAKLIGIEQHLVIRMDDGIDDGIDDGSIVRAVPEEGHAAQLTRDDVTSAVHYYRFEFSPEQVARFETAEYVTLCCDHSAYIEAAQLSDSTRAELLTDVRI